jgi:hypothetical protein
MANDFAGLNGSVWWQGVVEDRQDPLKLGRCRVRIIGWHEGDVNIVPTEYLPWAQIQLPVTSVRTFVSVKEGEWVTGYFLDGANAQEPVITGVLPGIISQEIRTVNSPVPQYGFTDRRTPQQIANSPKLPEGIVADTVGQPSLPPTAREVVENTAIDVSNNNQAHVCDITNELIKDNALIKISFSQLMAKIRDAIRAFIASLGLDPSGEISKLVSLAKALLRELKYIQTIIEEVLLFKQVLVDYARKIRAMIDYVLSLPAKLIALLQDCLSNFLGAITGILKDMLTIPGLEGNDSITDIGELATVVEDIVSTSKSVIQGSIDIITIPAQLTTAILTPATSQELNQASTALGEFLVQNTPNVDSVISTSTYSSANTRLP